MLNLILALICIAAGIAFLINYVRIKKRVNKITQNGKEIYAEIIEIPEGNNKKSVIYPVVEYESDGEKKQITDLGISEALGAYVGQPLIIIFDPENENDYLVKENIESKKYLNVGGMLGGSEAIVWAIVAFIGAALQFSLIFIG